MVDETHAQAERMGAPRAVALCCNFGGALELLQGKWDDAERHLREAVELYERLGTASGEALSLQRLGVLLCARGRLDEADEVLGRALVRAEGALMRSHCLTRVHASLARQRLATGDLAGAEHFLREGQETARRHGSCMTCNALLLPEAVRVALANGRLEDAELAARELERIAGTAESRIWTGMARHARARVFAANWRTEEACAAFAEAAAAFAAAGARHAAARCQAEHAAHLGETDPDAAAALAQGAARTLAELGASGGDVATPRRASTISS